MQRAGLPIAAVAIAAFVVGFGMARALDRPIVETGRADTMESGSGSISTDDWTYGFASETTWTDAHGTWNHGTAPACLEPGGSVNVTFAATEVSIDGSTWRPVVWVDCRTATPFP